MSCESEPTQIDISDIPEGQKDSVKNAIKDKLEAAYDFRLDDFIEIEGSDYVFFPVQIYTEKEREKISSLQNGRYGGYGAGLATGLMGFLQIYWDPNRQAIQDKISETLVVDIRKNKRR